jgi:hypothetical protein
VASGQPGLYGSQYGLQVDASRLPRVDEYDPSLVATEQSSAVKIPSDVKTISYFLRSDTDSGTSGTLGAGGTGLMRRELDRAVASMASQQSDPSQTDGELLAPEVNLLEFQYFDGTQWLTEWDSSQMGGLPLAIAITVGITPGGDASTVSAGASAAAADPYSADSTDHQYRLVVHLPVARPATSASSSSNSPSAATGATGPASGGMP